MTAPPEPKRTLSGLLIALAVGMAILLVLSEVVLRFAMPDWRDFYSGRFMRQTVVPGHGVLSTGRPGFDGYFAQNNGDFRVRITVNAFGLRNGEPVTAADGRIWIVGDSMAFGWGVEHDERYSSVIERALGAPTYNVASPGADVCGYQALVARMPENLKPRAVIVGLILENDIAPYDCRATARRQEEETSSGIDEGVKLDSWIQVKIAMIRYSALYNFLTVALKRIDIVREALTAIGIIRRGHAYRRAIEDDALDRVIGRTADELAALRAMLPRDTPFAVFITPGRFEIKDGDAFYRRLRLETGEALEARGLAVIDPFEGFVAAGFGPTHFAHDGHWSPLGHRVAGMAIAEWLAGNLRPPAKPGRGNQ